jgi:hypothetical protein
MGVLTVQFEVGEGRTESLVRLYNAVFSNQDWRPDNVGILPPIVKPKGIDDVPIVSATLWTDDPERGTSELLKVAHTLEAEIKRVPGTRDVYTIGGAQDIVHVELDPQLVAGFGMTLEDLRFALTASNVVTTLRGWWSACLMVSRSTSTISRLFAHAGTSRSNTPGLRPALQRPKPASIPSHTLRPSRLQLRKSPAPMPRTLLMPSWIGWRNWKRPSFRKA